MPAPALTQPETTDKQAGGVTTRNLSISVRRALVRPKIGDRVEFLRKYLPFKVGDRGTVEAAGSLALGIVLDHDPGRAQTLLGETAGVLRILASVSDHE